MSRYSRIHALLDADRNAEAAEACMELLTEDSADPIALSLLSVCQAQMGMKEAIKTAERCIAAAPDYFGGWHSLALAQIAQGKHKEAEKSARRCVELEPETTVGWYNLAISQHNQGKLRESLLSAEEGLMHDPEDADLGSLRASLLARLGRTDEARAAVAEGLRSSPDATDYHEARGLAELRAGHHHEAAGAFQEALRLQPNNAIASEGLKEALRHRILPYKLLAHLVSLLDRIPPGGRTALWIGLWLLYRTGRGMVRENPDLLPILLPLFIVYIVFVLFMWLGETFANTTLLFHPLGRLALSKPESLEAKALIGALGGAAICFGSAAAGSPIGIYGVIACLITVLLIGISSHLASLPKLRVGLAWGWIALVSAAALSSIVAIFL